MQTRKAMIVSVAAVAQFYTFASAFGAKLLDWLLGFTCVFSCGSSWILFPPIPQVVWFFKEDTL